MSPRRTYPRATRVPHRVARPTSTSAPPWRPLGASEVPTMAATLGKPWPLPLVAPWPAPHPSRRPERVIVGREAEDWPGAFNWGEQAAIFPPRGPAGLSVGVERLAGGDVVSVMFRDGSGVLHGVLNVAATSVPGLQAAGEYLVLVDPLVRGRGIGLRLLSTADRLCRIPFDAQTYTEAGVALMQDYLLGKGADPTARLDAFGWAPRLPGDPPMFAAQPSVPVAGP